MEMLSPILAVIASLLYIGVLFLVLAAEIVVSVLAAKRLAEDKGLSKKMMWIGILGWLGLVILCFIKKPAAEAVAEPAAEAEAE